MRDFAFTIADGAQITRSEAEYCIVRTGVVIDDLKAVHDAIQMNLDADEMERATRAGCFITCIGQKQGNVVGSKIQLERLHNFLDQVIHNDTVKLTFFKVIDACAMQVKNVVDECVLGRDFTICVMKQS